MAYSNYLVKVGSYTIPTEYIIIKTYQAKREIIDVDSYRDANGTLHRNALAHIPNTVDFDIMSLSGTEFATLMSNVQSNYSVPAERKAMITAFVPETNDYISQDMYIVKIDPVIDSIVNGVITYEPMHISCIGY